MADRLVGLAPVNAREQIFKAWPPHVGTQPLPPGAPQRIKPAAVGITDASPLRIVVIGDHGGVKDPNPQNAVATVISGQHPAAAHATQSGPTFCLSLGDVVYFNGDEREYVPQFYEPYAHCRYPFVAIPGNHDGDVTDDPSRKPLDTFLEHWCAASPELPKGGEEYQRHKQTLPWCDWTLDAGEATIIGLYTNVPSGGHLDVGQVGWLAQELHDAGAGKPVVVCLHHPPYSIDAHHGGSQKMGNAIDSAADAAGRHPDLVLSGHVHDYQRFTRTVGSKKVPYVVVGNSGYHNLHKLAPGAARGKELIPGVVFEEGDDSEYGFLTLSIGDGRIDGEYVGVTPGAAANLPPAVTRGKDSFSYSM